MSTLATNQFKAIAEIAEERWGLKLTDGKRQMITNRLTKFVRRSDFADIDAYVDHLQSGATEDEMLAFFDLLSTNVTSFFRERAHFDYLERELYTPIKRGTLTLPGRKLRIWSAACSTGPEPYSLGIHALEQLGKEADSWDIRILATDLSSSALKKAGQAVYPKNMVTDMPAAEVKRYFLKGKGDSDDMVKVSPLIRDMVTIRSLNLMDQWPFRGPFDIVFCRNVMIYFDNDTRERLVNRIADVLRPGGILAIGSAETLSSLQTPFKTVQPSVYVK